jgi:hypothetical protein
MIASNFEIVISTVLAYLSRVSRNYDLNLNFSFALFPSIPF